MSIGETRRDRRTAIDGGVRAMGPRPRKPPKRHHAGEWAARARLRCALIALFALGACMAVATPALALYEHPFLSSISGSTTASGSMFPFGVAVDNSSSATANDVYVVDFFHRVADRLSANGTYECDITGKAGAAGMCDPTTAAIPGGTFPIPFTGEPAVNGAGDLFIPSAAAHAIYEFGPGGEYLTDIPAPNEGEPSAVAVEADGNLLICDEKHHTVLRYEIGSAAMTTFASEAGGAPFKAVTDVAVDGDAASPSHGDVYVLDGAAHKVDVFDAAGVYQRQMGEAAGQPLPTLKGLAVDPSDGNVYVGAGTAIDQFGQTGSFIAQTTVPNEGQVEALAISRASGDIYAAVANKQILDVFGPGIVVPNATVAAAGEMTKASAVLNGGVDPAGGGEVTSCVFEYGQTTAYGQTAPCAPAGPYAVARNVSAAVTGLAEATTYHYRLKVANANGANFSEDASFVTPGLPAVGADWAVADPTSATLNTTIDPEEYETRCQAQYVSAREYRVSGYAHALTVPCQPTTLGIGGTYLKVVAGIAGLEAGETYHYRFLAANHAGATEGGDYTFSTFGFAAMPTAELLGEGGTPYTPQAGGHPFAYTVEAVFNTTSEPHTAYRNGTGMVRNVRVQLPPGLIGNPSAVERCAQTDAEREQCPVSSEVGLMLVEGTEGVENLEAPLFDVMPPRGVAARFAGQFATLANAYIDAGVRTGEGYGIEAASLNITTIKAVARVKVEMWGVPGAASHVSERYCRQPGSTKYIHPPCAEGEQALPAKPFLTTPTSCAGPLSTVVKVDAYQAPADYVTAVTRTSTGMRGCAKVAFTPRIAVAPEVSSASSPTGLTVKLIVPQRESSEGIAEADLKDATVTLPAGVTVNPSSANGLVGCPLLSGKEAHAGQVGIDLENGEAANCPNASKIGSVKIKTPLLEEEVEGGVYVAQQNANPFKSLLALYIAAEAPERGVVIKLAGHVELNPSTGQLTTTFDENPQLPFSELKLDFFGGERAPLATPRACGTYTTTSLLEPWSHQPAPGEAAGTPNASPESPFSITSGPGGAACDPPAFAPGFTAGTANNHGGSFSPFVMNLTRNDGEQRLTSILQQAS